MKITNYKKSNVLFIFASFIILVFELNSGVNSYKAGKFGKSSHSFKIENSNEESGIEDVIAYPNRDLLENQREEQKINPKNDLFKCDLKRIGFAGAPTTSFTEFFPAVKTIWERLTSYDIKSIYKFLDSENIGYFTSKRWDNFVNLFLDPFVECDVDQDCLLNETELNDCFEKEDTKIVVDYLSPQMSKDYLVREIISSMDSRSYKGINFYNYLLLKKVIIGYLQFNVQGIIDASAFHSAIKTTFIDNLIDQGDSDLAFRVGVSLMFDQINYFQLNFIQFFEICRIINAYISHDLPITEGFITKDNLLHNFENDRFHSKLDKHILEEYFMGFEQDKKLVKENKNRVPSDALRFEDYAVLEFYANIFKNYTDSSSYGSKLNSPGFINLFSTNKYIRKKYLIYISYSNFEDPTKMNQTNRHLGNIIDYDFITNQNFDFLEIENHVNFFLNEKNNNLLRESIKKNLVSVNSQAYDYANAKINLKHKYSKSDKLFKKDSNANTQKNSVFSEVMMESSMQSNKEKAETASRTHTESLFNFKLTEEDEDNNDSNPNSNSLSVLLEPSLKNYFKIIDSNNLGYLKFNDFIKFIKYLRLWDKLNRGNADPRGILNTNNINYFKVIKVQPKKSLFESERLKNLDSLECKYVDFLMFTDYMLAPKIFLPFLERKNSFYTHKMNLKLVLQKLNLFADLHYNKLFWNVGNMMRNNDYEMILNVALKKKCVSNGLIFNTTDEFSTVNPEQLLNPTLVKPANVPKFNRSQEYIRFQDYEHSYNKSSMEDSNLSANDDESIKSFRFNQVTKKDRIMKIADQIRNKIN